MWHPANDTIGVRDYTNQYLRLRRGREGGGVAILTHRKVKAVHLKEYEVDNLEAVWAEVKVGKVRTVVGSVYIAPGDKGALNVLDSVIGKILQSHENLIIGMDANARNGLWDDACLQGGKNTRLGIRLEEIIENHSLHIHNTGVATFRAGNYATAPDVTLSKGMMQYGKVTWTTVDDELRTPHEGIMMEIGSKVEVERQEVIDWKKFDWDKYREVSRGKLVELYENWNKFLRSDCDKMVHELVACIQRCVDEVAGKKVVTSHSRPWINRTIAERLKELRNARRKCRLRKLRVNCAQYERIKQETFGLIKKAEDEWWLAECEKLEVASEKEKWKIINKLTSHTVSSEVQPIRKTDDNGSTRYLFEEEEIRRELESYHVRRSHVVRRKCDENIQSCVEKLALEAKAVKVSGLMNKDISDAEVIGTFGKGSDTAGPDGISAKLIDEADRGVMHECLTLLWNVAWKEGYFMESWKQENRVVLPKPGKDDYGECNAYRTVSITSCLGKRFELFTVNRLMDLLESSNFDMDQFAYISGRSTTQAVVEKVKKALLMGKEAGALFFFIFQMLLGV